MTFAPILPAGARCPVAVRAGLVAVRDVGGLDLREPFFDRSLDRATTTPSWVPMSELATAPPVAAIAHVGRCGSTLAARLLDRAGLTTIREPSLLTVPHAPGHDVLGWYGALQPGSVVVKLSSTASPRLADTLGHRPPPVIAIVRDPHATIASALRSPPRHATLLYAEPHEVRAAWPVAREPDDDRPPTHPRLLLRAWRSAVEGILSWSGSPLVITHHHDLVRDPAAEVRRWTELLGLPAVEADLHATAQVDAKRGGAWSAPLGPAFPPAFAREIDDQTRHLADRLASHGRGAP